jgi:prephenate dehydratase
MTPPGPESGLRLSYLGPRGTFSEEAALKYQEALGRRLEMVPLPTISAVVEAVRSGRSDQGLVPIENSLEGSVNETLDDLIHSPSPIHIRHEIVIPIEHCLLVRPGVTAAEIDTIFAHPQAFAQCRAYLERRFPGVRVEAALSNAAAVEEMMARDRAAAIGARRAAEIYGAQILESGIQDRAANVTRFVVLAEQDHEPTGSDKTTIAFTFAVEDRPGLLVRSLEEFATRSINLSKIESRPSKERLGTYIFLVDVDGHRTSPPLAEALAAIETQCSFFRILGSYPRFKQPG